MKTAHLIFWIATLVLSAGPLATSAAETGVVLESASIVPGAAGEARLFLVINNLSANPVTLTAVDSPVASEVILVRSSGEPVIAGAIVPPHSELYMQPGTVHVVVRGLSAPLEVGSTFPLSLFVDGGAAVAAIARVVDDETALPDHHYYQH